MESRGQARSERGVLGFVNGAPEGRRHDAAARGRASRRSLGVQRRDERVADGDAGLRDGGRRLRSGERVPLEHRHSLLLDEGRRRPRLRGPVPQWIRHGLQEREHGLLQRRHPLPLRRRDARFRRLRLSPERHPVVRRILDLDLFLQQGHQRRRLSVRYDRNGPEAGDRRAVGRRPGDLQVFMHEKPDGALCRSVARREHLFHGGMRDLG